MIVCRSSFCLSPVSRKRARNRSHIMLQCCRRFIPLCLFASLPHPCSVARFPPGPCLAPVLPTPYHTRHFVASQMPFVCHNIRALTDNITGRLRCCHAPGVGCAAAHCGWEGGSCDPNIVVPPSCRSFWFSLSVAPSEPAKPKFRPKAQAKKKPPPPPLPSGLPLLL